MGKGKFSKCLLCVTGWRGGVGGDDAFLTEGQGGRLSADVGVNKPKCACAQLSIQQFCWSASYMPGTVTVKALGGSDSKPGAIRRVVFGDKHVFLLNK